MGKRANVIKVTNMIESQIKSDSPDSSLVNHLDSSHPFENARKLTDEERKQQLVLISKLISDIKENPDNKQTIITEFYKVADPIFVKDLEKFLKEGFLYCQDGPLFGIGIAYMIQITEYINNTLHRNFDTIYKYAKWDARIADRDNNNSNKILTQNNIIITLLLVIFIILSVLIYTIDKPNTP